MAISIGRSGINSEEIARILLRGQEISLDKEVRETVIRCRAFLEEQIEKTEKPIYGVNTGFGSLCNTEISKEEISELQSNLVLSHACGMGEEISPKISKLMLLLKIINLSRGHSGIRLETLDRLIFMYNKGVSPVIYEMGSLGASGDLSPLAHLSLPLFGKGEVIHGSKRMTGQDFLDEFKLERLTLGAKEGLALLNGTQFMSAFGLHIIISLKGLLSHSDLVTAMSLDAFDCLPEPFSKEIHEVRPHPGQVEVAESIRNILKGSQIFESKKTYVQDPYSFRCIPQVHGASLDTIRYVGEIFDREIRSVTDNPLIFPDAGKILSGGNFHGQPLALALDFLSIAIAELASISERRLYKLISGQRNLPPFLTPNPGLHSGFMIPQYTAASLVSQNKQLCTPSSVDTIDSSNGQEDHVSMGANSALKCLKVLENYRKVLAIELMNAAQALEFRRPLRSSKSVEGYLTDYRKKVPFLKADEVLHVHMKESENFLKS